MGRAAAIWGGPSLSSVAGWARNDNGTLCHKAFPPHQNGSPAYCFVAIDD